MIAIAKFFKEIYVVQINQGQIVIKANIRKMARKMSQLRK